MGTSNDPTTYVFMEKIEKIITGLSLHTVNCCYLLSPRDSLKYFQDIRTSTYQIC